MKKSVVILIGIIYLAAIVLVSFYGLKPEVVKVQQKVTEVKITAIVYPNGERYDVTNHPSDEFIDVYPDEDGVWRFKLEYTVAPEDATNKDVLITNTKYTSDTPEEERLITVDDDGTISILAPIGSFDLIVGAVNAQDENAFDVIKIFPTYR